MPVYANNFYVMGTLSGMSLYTNTLAPNEMSNISVNSDIAVNGSISTNKYMDVGTTLFATFRLASNLSFQDSSELFPSSNTFVMDMTSTDMSGMAGMNTVIPPNQVYSYSTGHITVPKSGLYNLEMQGVFQNDPAATNVQNGVYYYFLNHPYPSARTGAVFTSGSMVSTSMTRFLLGGDVFLPTFYSNDPNATLLPSNGESYVGFSVAATVTPTHSNYVRVPLS